jgi:hypothetical protein
MATDGIRMHNPKWHLFTLRTQIEMRMLQLGFRHRLRIRIAKIIAGLADIPRQTSFARRLEAKQKVID